MDMDLTTPVEIDGTHVESFLDKLQALSLGSFLKIIVLMIVLLVLVRLLTRCLDRILEKSKVDRSLHGFLHAGVRIVLYTIAVMIVAGSLDIDVTSLIAVLSVAGLAVSLALQGTLANIASGIMILTAKPFHVGDYVDIGGQEGFAQEIGMTYTKLTAYDRRIIHIPNSTVTSSDIVNYTTEGKRRVEIVVTASYEAKVEEVKAALLEAVGRVPAFLEEEPVFARVTGYQESAIEYTVRAWARNESYWDCHFDLLEEVKRSFDRNGIQMTYPHLNVHMTEK